jgi:glycosyltransferase involved in cell wall biosynthesis
MINTTPLVSIIIPVYNRENIISETLECAINQTYKNIEIIISDNCSTDNTWQVLTKYLNLDSRIRIYKNQINLGPVLNWKSCIDKINGEYTKILWSDDTISLDFIEQTIKLFDAETAFVMSGVQIFKSENKSVISNSVFQERIKYLSSDYIEDVVLYNKINFPVSPGCAIFRSVDILNSFSEHIPNYENLDFKRFGAGNDLMFFLLTANKYKYIKTLNSVSSFFRSHSNSLTISNNLDLYYEYSKLYFVINYAPILLEYYHFKILLKCLKNPIYYKLFFKTKWRRLSFLKIYIFIYKKIINS